jgi:hypothetical protein
VLLLAALNLVLMLAAAGVGRPNSTLWLMTLTPPWLEYASLLSYDDALALWRGGTFQIAGSRPVFGPEMIGVVLTGLTLYGLAALVLTGASAEAYDRVAGRARRAPGRGAAVTGVGDPKSWRMRKSASVPGD